MPTRLIKKIKTLQTKDELCNYIQNLIKKDTIKKSQKKCLSNVKLRYCNSLIFEPISIPSLEEDAKEKIGKFLKGVLIRKKNTSKPFSFYKFIKCNFFDVDLDPPKRVPKVVSRKLITLIRDFEKNNLKKIEKHPFLDGSCSTSKINIQVINKNLVADPLSLFNRNLTIPMFRQELEELVKKQERFIDSLDWRQKICIFFYTYGGDKMVNNFLLGENIMSTQVIPEEDTEDTFTFYVRFMTTNIYPLTLFLYLDLIHCKKENDILNRHGKIREDIQNKLKDLWKKIKGKKFSQAYEPIFRFFVENRKMFPEEILKTYIQEFLAILEEILKKVPKTQSQFWVYRGIKKKDYVIIGKEKKYIFLNRSFMSTSLNLCMTGDFKDPQTNCCIQQILVPKGVSCLFISMISSFPDEQEILFPPRSFLYPISDDYVASNVDIQTRKFVIAN